MRSKPLLARQIHKSCKPESTVTQEKNPSMDWLGLGAYILDLGLCLSRIGDLHPGKQPRSRRFLLLPCTCRCAIMWLTWTDKIRDQRIATLYGTICTVRFRVRGRRAGSPWNSIALERQHGGNTLAAGPHQRISRVLNRSLRNFIIACWC